MEIITSDNLEDIVPTRDETIAPSSRGPPQGFQQKVHIPKSEYKKQLRAKAKERRTTAESVVLTTEELAAHFAKEKKQTIENLTKNVDDRSRAGKADEDIRSFLDTVNKKRNMYTTSSCAGRAIVTQTPGNGYAIDWLFVDHRGDLPGASQLIWDALSPLLSDEKIQEKSEKIQEENEEENSGENSEESSKPPVRKQKGVEVWLKMEPPIVSISCASIETAQSLLDLARGEASLKNCSIRSTNNGHAMLALVDTHRIEAPLAKDGKLLITREYLDVLLDSAREKLAKGRGRMEMMRKAIEAKIQDDEVEQQNEK